MEFKILDRSVWGAQAPKRRYSIQTPSRELWAHHTAGAQDAGSNDRWADDIKGIQSFHMDDRGWSDIAYSFLVDQSGQAWEGRGAGVAGGHTKGRNSVSHAICAIGNFEKVAPTDELLETFAQLVAHGHAEGWWPRAITGPHSAAPGASTACCGKYLAAELPNINARATEIFLGETKAPTPTESSEPVATHPQAGKNGLIINDCLNELDAIALAVRGSRLNEAEFENWSRDLVNKVYVEGQSDLSGVTRWFHHALSAG